MGKNLIIGNHTWGTKRVHTRLAHRLHVVSPTVGHQRNVGVPLWRGAMQLTWGGGTVMLALFPEQLPGMSGGKQEGCHAVVPNGPVGHLDVVARP
jgi:hypothetical protein